MEKTIIGIIIGVIIMYLWREFTNLGSYGIEMDVLIEKAKRHPFIAIFIMWGLLALVIWGAMQYV